jgi:pimeloyl-ACP methyl ester carboxylesterase
LGDLPENERKVWLQELKSQPADDWDDTVTYAGWKDVPSVYVVTELDKVLPVPIQEQLAGLANSKVERINAGHLPQLSQPEKMAEIIATAATAF